jgi:hypothetical protein
LTAVAAKWIKDDLKIRFRPVYYLHRVAECRFFGDNLFLWSLYTGFLAFVTFTLFYLGMRGLRFSTVESLVFSALIFSGPQMAVWWRLGPAETIGIVLLSLCFYFMARGRKNFALNSILFSIFLILSSWCKESFTIIIPAFLFLKIWLDVTNLRIGVLACIRKNWVLVAPASVLIVNMFVILFVVGKTTMGHAGVGGSVPALMKGILWMFQGGKQLEDIARLTLAMILCGTLCYAIAGKRRAITFFGRLIAPLIFALLIIVPNVVLYARSGMYQRYLLPATLGFAFLIIYLMRETRGDYRWLYKIFVFACLFFFTLPHLNTALKHAGAFTREGRETNRLLTSITRNATEHSKLLIVADPVRSFESTYSLRHYLSHSKKGQLYVLGVDYDSRDEVSKALASSWYSSFSGRGIADLPGSPDLIVFFDSALMRRVIKKNVLDLSRYENLLDTSSRFAVLMKKQAI